MNKFWLLFLVPLGLITCKLDKSEVGESDQNRQFELIKRSPKRLGEFLQNMPKGGDLHHHSQGSVPAESYLRAALADSLWINPSSFHVHKQRSDDSAAILINELIDQNPEIKERIIDHWTVRNYKAKGRDGHDWFFASFGKFLPIFEGHEAEFLTEMCAKAEEDNISYLETMISVQSIDRRLAKMALSIPPSRDKEPVKLRCERWKAQYDSLGIMKLVSDNIDSLDQIWYRTNKGRVHLNFQLYGVRVIPVKHLVFGQLYMAFHSAYASRQVVGINILAPEDNEVALRHYRDHMKMIEFLREYYPNVQISLHAGELVKDKGDTRDHDLKFHIENAIKVARASRIGHGVDLLEEDESKEILRYMREKDIAVEINLESNEVILETTQQTHPIEAYWKAGVPVCISTDDEGVLRTNLSNQYRLLLKYLPDLQYTDLKEIVRNGVKYSFLRDGEKELVMEDLERRFKIFESENFME